MNLTNNQTALIIVVLILLVILMGSYNGGRKNRYRYSSPNDGSKNEHYLSQAPVHRSFTSTWKTHSLSAPRYTPTRSEPYFANLGMLQGINLYKCMDECRTRQDEEDKEQCFKYCDEQADVVY